MILSVFVPVPLPQQSLTYLYQGKAEVGARVLVPLGRREIVGLIAAVEHREPEPDEKLKPIIELLDLLPVVDMEAIDTIGFATRYYLCSPSDVLRSLIPAPLLTTTYCPCVRLLKNRHKKIAPIYETPSVDAIISAGDVTLVHHRFDYPMAEAIAATHAQAGATLVIVPSRFEAERVASQISRYAPTVLYHKQLSTSRRADIYVDLSMVAREVIVVGTLSALCLSVVGLERIFVLSEDSSMYKNQRTPRISARDLAVYTASRRSVNLFLMSELPSVESFYNAHSQPSWSYSNLCGQLPEPHGMRLEHGTDFLSKYLRRRIAEELSASRQVVVMQNRRGFGTPVCSVCGYVPMCPACNCSLTLHLWKGAVECHYCGHSEPYETRCPKCAAEMSDTRGRGTERVVEQLRELFPSARIERLDSDSAPDFTNIVERFVLRSTDILVGTRVVVDSLDYSGVGLVAVVNADNLLSAPDFRASEDAFRIVYKLARRAAATGAEVVLQTSQYTNTLLAKALAGDALSFYRSEAADRRAARYPPFTRLVEIDLRSQTMPELIARGQALEASLREVFGASLSPIFQPQVERQQGVHVLKILLRVDRRESSVRAKRQLMDIIGPFERRTRKILAVELIVDPL